MIRASDPPFLNAAITERGAPVRAAIVKQTHSTCLVAKQHQGFAENLYHLRGILSSQLARDAYGKPIAPQQLARGCARSHAGQSLVLFFCQHGFILPDVFVSPSTRASRASSTIFRAVKLMLCRQ